MAEIVIPYLPREHQLALHDALDKNRFVVGVMHRRFGKTVAAINQIVKRAIECDLESPRYAYVAPTKVDPRVNVRVAPEPPECVIETAPELVWIANPQSPDEQFEIVSVKVTERVVGAV